MVPYIPMRAKILQNSLIYFSVYFVPAWYSLICIVKISDLRNIISIYVMSNYRPVLWHGWCDVCVYLHLSSVLWARGGVLKSRNFGLFPMQ